MTSRWLLWLRVALVLPLLGGGAAVAQQQGEYLQPFNGAPAAPQPYRADVDVTVHNANFARYETPDPIAAHHGVDCSPPLDTHAATTYEALVFLCRDHLMTALNTPVYGVIYLAPPALLDWSVGPATLRFDMSTLRTSTRDWPDLWVSPWTDALQLPLETWLPDLNGPPARSIHMRLDNWNGGNTWRGLRIENFVQSDLPTSLFSYENYLTPSAVTRTTFELTLSVTHVRFGMPAYNAWWVDTALDPPLNYTSGVVQLGHHSYNPTKECLDNPSLPPSDCVPNTWHWDNLSLAPSIPFTAIPGSPRQVNNLSPSQRFDFPEPAPPGSALRIACQGPNPEYSLDGMTWAPLGMRAQQSYDAATAQNCWQPVPEGTRSVWVRASGSWWGPQWQVKHASLWSQEPLTRRTPTPTPPVVPPTLPPTATLPPAATATATTVPTLTPTPQPPPPPTATPAPAPADAQCARIAVVDGVWSVAGVVCP